MAKLNKEELSKLTADERIRRLKQLERENRKEIEEAGKLIKETEAAIKRERIAESVKVPETKPVDIGALFKEEGAGLESAVEQEAASAKEDGGGALYQLAQDYKEAKGMLYSDEPLTEEQLRWVDKLGERAEKAKYQTTSDQVANLANAARVIAYKLRKYHSPS